MFNFYILLKEPEITSFWVENKNQKIDLDSGVLQEILSKNYSRIITLPYVSTLLK